jgi:Ca-activated chloride channel family protein
LRPEDRVAIVVYAGASGLVLPSTPGDQKDLILSAIGSLYPGGSTAGAAGIKLAYEIAKKNFIENGNNRVILATDGDFNVGVSSDGELVRLIEKKREEGVFLTVLGFGTGNLKDSRMEKLADKGNGNYSYIDNIMEARKVLVSELGGTLLTIAKDVKIQLEFNPARVLAYRLIGYENRMLKKEDFNDDKKDAGEIGSGHTVTAIYEIIPAGADEKVSDVDELKYQRNGLAPEAYNSDELLTVKFRYKKPDGDKSKLITAPVADEVMELAETSDNFRFSAAVAEFGMLLRDSEHKGGSNFDQVIAMASGSKGEDSEGYRDEFIRLVKLARDLSKPVAEK